MGKTDKDKDKKSSKSKDKVKDDFCTHSVKFPRKIFCYFFSNEKVRRRKQMYPKSLTQKVSNIKIWLIPIAFNIIH